MTSPTPFNVSPLLQAAAEALRRGEAREALAPLREALRIDPGNAAAAANLGVALKALGVVEEAIEWMMKAARLAPDDPAIHYNLGNALLAAGRTALAMGAFDRALALKPDFGQAAFNLGNCLRDEGRWAEAADAYRRAVELLPSLPAAPLRLARALMESHKDAEAVPAAARAVALAPQDPEAHATLSQALWSSGRAAEAEAAARAALRLNPDHRAAWAALGVALQSRGRDGEALACFQSLAQSRPDDATNLSNLGATLNKLGRHEDALAPLREAVRLRPRMAAALANLANSLNHLRYLGEAEENARRALAIDPPCAEARMQLGYALHYQGRLHEAIECYESAAQRQPENPEAGSNLLYLQTYRGDISPREVSERHFAWGRELQRNHPPARSWNNDRDPDRPLRVGYVSPDFRSHSVALFLEPILARHDSRRIQPFCYSNVGRPDAVTARLQALGHPWRNLYGVNDEEASRLILGDQIDILVDLAGHTAGNRLPLFALKTAPVQVSYLGYPATTGLEAIDYYITDEWCDPAGAHDGLFSEKLFRLGRCKLCYRPRSDLPAPGPLPARRNGYVSFGSFNNLVKYNDAVLRLWADVLRAVPASVLTLKAQWFRDDSTRGNFLRRFAALDIAENRLRLVDYSHDMSDIDIALDPFPFNGATTTCHAFLMGLPPVSLKGDSHCSRVTCSLLAAVGLGELAVETPEAYVAKAVELAADLDRLEAWRHGLRDCLLESPICDETGFVRVLENVYRTIWREWVESGRSIV